MLLVEDQQTVRRLVSRILRGQGYHVLEACHGAEALRICREFDGEIHLVVTDVIMPQMGGKELARRLAGERPETRILYISGYSADDPAGDTRDDPHLSPAPAHPPRHHFLQKPFTIDALTRKVRQVLDTPGPSR